jgi:hypothetical protein
MSTMPSSLNIKSRRSRSHNQRDVPLHARGQSLLQHVPDICSGSSPTICFNNDIASSYTKFAISRASEGASGFHISNNKQAC